ncbi:hypothetical protein J6590_056891 [Homalodisca vitripennis]|nr:hypothetical protein J6590_056891 [Homalodisca vitripennis]
MGGLMRGEGNVEYLRAGECEDGAGMSLIRTSNGSPEDVLGRYRPRRAQDLACWQILRTSRSAVVLSVFVCDLKENP